MCAEKFRFDFRVASAFTLIEMLVVIAIISILASMLAPSLRNAIASAEAVSCANNQKNIGVAFSMYANDYNNVIPPLDCGNGTDPENGQWTHFTWYRALWAYCVAPLSEVPCNAWQASFAQTIFFCPSDVVTTGGSTVPAINQGPYIRYGINFSIFNGVGSSPAPKVRAKSPSKNQLMGEVLGTFSCYQYTYYNFGSAVGMGIISHNDRTTFLFNDYHVEQLSYYGEVPEYNYSAQDFKVFWDGK